MFSWSHYVISRTGIPTELEIVGDLLERSGDGQWSASAWAVCGLAGWFADDAAVIAASVLELTVQPLEIIAKLLCFHCVSSTPHGSHVLPPSTECSKCPHKYGHVRN